MSTFSVWRKRIFYMLAASFIAVPIGAVAQTLPGANSGVEARVREYFVDLPVMIDIAKCETNFRQFQNDGQALHDASGQYVGLFQIDEQAHFMAAWGLGLNLYTLDGNMAYARYLYGKSGARPWSGCVKSASAVASSAAARAASPVAASGAGQGGKLTRNLRMGMTNDEVRTVQQLLNKLGYTIADSGPGSPGSETTMFGPLTREALRKFQCAKLSVCEGSEGTTGYGRVGPATRAALNASF
jgi:hypothetical protein